MKSLKPVVLKNATALADAVAESLPAVEPGLTMLERGFAAGETLVDVLAVDATRRLMTLVVELEADAAAVVRALEAAAWCRESWALVSRLFAGADLDLVAPVRPVLVARHLSDRALRLLRALGPLAPTALECRVFEASGERCIYYEDLSQGGGRQESRRDAPEGGSEPAAAADVKPTRRGRAAAEPRDRGEPPASERARSMIERLEALRSRQAFQP